MIYYVDTDDSAICPRCFANDPCDATEHTTVDEAIQCSRCDEDIRESEPDYPESLKDVLFQAEQEMLALDSQLGVDEVEERAWNAYQAGICPCGDPECSGAWLFEDDPFAMI